MTRERDQVVENIGHITTNITAVVYREGLNQLERERRSATTGPVKGETAGVITSDQTSITERNAIEAARLAELADNLRDARDGFEIAHKHLLMLSNQACRTRAFRGTPHANETNPEEPAVQIKLCRDSQFGRTGAVVWGDPMCPKAPVKAGLCGTHYMAWYRYRLEHGDSVERDFEP